MIHVGHYNYINSNKILVIIKNNNNAGYKKLVEEKRKEGMLIQLDEEPKSAIVTDTGLVILVKHGPETIVKKN